MEMFGLLIVVGFILLFGLIIFFSFRSHRVAQAHKEEVAYSAGFTPLLQPPQELSQRIIDLFENSGSRRFKLNNIWRKYFPDGEIYLFDLRETSGEDDSVLADQGVLFVSRYLNLPRFALFPRLDLSGKMADIANRFLNWAYSQQGNQVDLRDHPAFNQRYVVIGDDGSAIREFLDPSLLDRLANTQYYNLNASEDAFVFAISNFGNIRNNKRDIWQQDLGAVINQGLQLYSWLSTSEKQVIEKGLPACNVSGLTHCSQCGAPLLSASEGSLIDKCGYCGSLVRAPLKASVAKSPELPDDSNDWSLNPNGEWIKQESERKGSRTIQILEQLGCTLPFALFWTAFSTIFLVAGIAMYLNERLTFDLLTREGVQSIAFVTDLSIDSDSDGEETYYVRYEYIVPISGDAITMSNRQSVAEREYNQLERGMKVEILYAASQPSISELKSTFRPPDLMLPVCFGGLGLLFTLIGVGLMAGALSSIGRALFKKGGEGKLSESKSLSFL
jgi:Ca2+/Na+ antiporter